jgi:cytochrome c553
MRLPIIAYLILILSVCSAYADGIGNDAQPAYEMCAACHGLDGVSHMPKFPKLAGQSPEYIVKQLEDFLHGRRTNDDGQMKTAAQEITDAQRLEVAQYFSRLPPSSGQAGLPDETILRGREIFEMGNVVAGVPACATCHAHASGMKGSVSAIPHLTGQHRSYTAKQLEDFQSGSRGNDSSGAMQSIAKQLSAQDIEAVAAFLEAAPGSP